MWQCWIQIPIWNIPMWYQGSLISYQKRSYQICLKWYWTSNIHRERHGSMAFCRIWHPMHNQVWNSAVKHGDIFPHNRGNTWSLNCSNRSNRFCLSSSWVRSPVDPELHCLSSWCPVDPALICLSSWCSVDPALICLSSWCPVDPALLCLSSWCSW